MCISSLCFIIGFIYSIIILIKIAKWFVKYFFPSKVDFKTKYGDGWVLITGGSEGIGFAFAEEFAKQNFKILLISRSEDKLKKAKKIYSGIKKLIKWIPMKSAFCLSEATEPKQTKQHMVILNQQYPY